MTEDIADRAALAIDYARAYAAEQQAREIAEAAIAHKNSAFALLDTLFSSAPSGLAFVDADLRYVRVNEALATMNGVPVTEHLGRRIPDVLPHLASVLEPIYCGVLATGQPLINREISGETLAAPGKQRHWLASYYPVRTPDATTIGVGVIVSEVTEQKLAEATLRESERRFRMLAENAHDLIFRYRLDPPGFDFVNGVVTRLSGYTPEEHYAGLVDPVAGVHPADREQFEAFRAQIGQNPSPNTYRFVHRDGRVAWVEQSTWLATDEAGRPVAHEGIVRDVTAAKQAEQQLREYADEMRALSLRVVQAQEDERRHLAHELHDEIGQLLTGLNMVLEAKPDASPEQLRAKLRAAQQVITDLTGRVRQLSLDLRPSLLDDLGLLPTLLWHMRRFSEQTGIAVDFKHSGLDAALPAHVTLAAYRIVQEGLTNIARYAGADAATVRVWARRGQLHINVEDNGRGFDAQAALNAHRSLGLVGIRERALRLGGQCAIESAPGEGAQIAVSLPLAAAGKEAV